MSVEAFLARAGWGDAQREPLAGDASTRRYERLHRGRDSAVLMIAPPQERAAFDAFQNIAGRLRAAGLSAPDVLEASPDSGLMLLEDLGAETFADLPDAQGPNRVAVDVLAHLATRGPWPVNRLTPDVMARMTAIALPEGAEAALAAMEAEFARIFTDPLVPALRDFHAENLIWLPERAGLARVGLLDFQDAVMAPPGYDLTSLTHDARRDMGREGQAELTARYAGALGLGHDRFATQCAALVFQRNLRIMGVFRRLARARGKPGYLAHLPRVYGHVTGALRHPELSDLSRAMAPHLEAIAP
ncbi:aminoglycoside phosphotransferase family protein [Alterinioella nitratireducens]|uniref:aminoglycoside phosphotransferase family protein n=1 Tax=Alterinioella nitratireducens TaxID=2735915 RepID=UPI001553D3B5|nr:phosphotransferase [Alterinioella nitratireducens]NPD20119.1 phosphotransferase [Alterinioella nitratireducens]